MPSSISTGTRRYSARPRLFVLARPCKGRLQLTSWGNHDIAAGYCSQVIPDECRIHRHIGIGMIDRPTLDQPRRLNLPIRMTGVAENRATTVAWLRNGVCAVLRMSVQLNHSANPINGEARVWPRFHNHHMTDHPAKRAIQRDACECRPRQGIRLIGVPNWERDRLRRSLSHPDIGVVFRIAPPEFVGTGCQQSRCTAYTRKRCRTRSGQGSLGR